MKTRIATLIAQVNAQLKKLGYGAKARLAERLKIRPQHLSRWLAGDGEPDAEHALALQEWIATEKRK